MEYYTRLPFFSTAAGCLAGCAQKLGLIIIYLAHFPLPNFEGPFSNEHGRNEGVQFIPPSTPDERANFFLIHMNSKEGFQVNWSN